MGILLASACNDFLKEKDKDQVIPRTVEHFLQTLHRETFIQNMTNYTTEFMLTFLTNPAVLADDNASERSVRPVKTKMKVSGQFKKDDGTTSYTNLNSIIQTARKNNRDPFAALAELVRL